jgi:hypothetical protein
MVANYILDAENRVAKCVTNTARNSTPDVADMVDPLKSSVCEKKKNMGEEGKKVVFCTLCNGAFCGEFDIIQSVSHMLNTLYTSIRKIYGFISTFHHY